MTNIYYDLIKIFVNINYFKISAECKSLYFYWPVLKYNLSAVRVTLWKKNSKEIISIKNHI